MNKKSILISLIFLCLSLIGLAQVKDASVITLTASLKSSLSISIDQSPINFKLDTDDAYENGVGFDKQTYSSIGSVSATANWKLSCKAINDFVHQDGMTKMPLNNIGIRAKYNGKTKVYNYADNAPQALSRKEIDLIGYDGIHSNANDKEENSFVLYWEMGTKKGNMNSQSLLKQNLKKGNYSTQIEMVVVEVFK